MVPTVYFDLLFFFMFPLFYFSVLKNSLGEHERRNKNMVPTVYFDLLLTSPLLSTGQRHRGQDHQGSYGSLQGRHMGRGGSRGRRHHTAARGRPREKHPHQPQRLPPSSSCRSSRSGGQVHSSRSDRHRRKERSCRQGGRSHGASSRGCGRNTRHRPQLQDRLQARPQLPSSSLPPPQQAPQQRQQQLEQLRREQHHRGHKAPQHRPRSGIQQQQCRRQERGRRSRRGPLLRHR